MEYKYNDDHSEVLVLVSQGFGAGWSTWNIGELCCDKRVIDLFLEVGPLNKYKGDERKEKEDYILSRLREWYSPRDHFCLLGWDDIIIDEVPIGSFFRVTEYDGAEEVEIFIEDGWFRAE